MDQPAQPDPPGAFPLHERMDMLLVYVEADRIPHRARRMYQLRYPLRHLPSRGTFRQNFVNLQIHGRFVAQRIVNPRVVCDEAVVAFVEAQIHHNPHAGQRSIAENVMASRYAVQTIMKLSGYHPFKVHLNQELHGLDFQYRVAYWNWMQAGLGEDPLFSSKALFTDESTFHNDCTVNRHNSHYYTLENPHWVMDNHIRDRWSVNMWVGVIRRHVIGPYFIEDGPLNGVRYLRLLQEDLDGLLAEAPAREKRIR